MRVPRQILAPIDFSGTAEAATDYAIGLARALGARLHLVHVVAPEWAIDLALVPHFHERAAEAARERLLGFERRVQAAQVDVESTVARGNPSATLIDLARARHVDLIIMGTEGHGAIEHLLVGSVANKVLHCAPCPVLTLRHPHRQNCTTAT